MLAAFLLAASASGFASSTVGTAASFYGAWHVDSIVGYGEVSVSDDELRRLVGQQVVISKDSLKIGSDDCSVNEMQASEQDITSLLLREYKAGRKDAGLSARTLALNAEPCGYVFRSGKGIVVYQDGAFYRASRAKRAY
ncbi:hypothetical protein [Trinickia dinghuensis]|nr:hypothetical protein [Trinickia dinghuensis]